MGPSGTRRTGAAIAVVAVVALGAGCGEKEEPDLATVTETATEATPTQATAPTTTAPTTTAPTTTQTSPAP